MSDLNFSETARCEALFELDRVVVEADGRRILDEITGRILPHGITVVGGPSGSGKSTFLRLLNRLEVPSSGRVLYRGRDLGRLDPLAHRREVGMVFQRPVLFGGTVRDNLEVAAPGLTDDRAAAALERVGISAVFLERQAASISGGEAQRVCIARALLADPAVLLLDEPTSALDAAPRLSLEELTQSLAASGMAMVWVTHDLTQMERIASEVIVLIGGKAEFWGALGQLPDAASDQVTDFLKGGEDAS